MLGILLVALVALGGVIVIAWPLVVRSDALEPASGDHDIAAIELNDDIERSLRALRELEFDHRAGNLTEADFAELDRAERARAAELLRRRDGLRADRHREPG